MRELIEIKKLKKLRTKNYFFKTFRLRHYLEFLFFFVRSVNWYIYFYILLYALFISMGLLVLRNTKKKFQIVLMNKMKQNNNHHESYVLARNDYNFHKKLREYFPSL